MGWLHWFTRNRADTRLPTHPDLAPLTLHGPPVDAISSITRVVEDRLPRWAVVSKGTGELHLTRTTRLFRFVDDIRLELEPGPGNTSRVHATSQSRVGTGDFGQNRRNILELWEALRAAGVTS